MIVLSYWVIHIGFTQAENVAFQVIDNVEDLSTFIQSACPSKNPAFPTLPSVCVTPLLVAWFPADELSFQRLLPSSKLYWATSLASGDTGLVSCS